MFFTKDSNGFRGWFTVTQSNGVVRTGLVSGDFTVTVVDGDDSASQVFAVNESSQKSGLYYFDISSTFLLSNGIGDYGIIVEVDTFLGPSGAPNVRDTFSNVLNVAEKDLNDIAGATTIADIQNSLSNVENIVTNIETDVTTIFSTLISEQFNAVGSSLLNENTIPTGNVNYPDDFFNGQLVVLITNYNSYPVILARTISDYFADGTIVVSPGFPIVPSDGDQLIILARTATAAVDNNAIANAVWTIATSPTIANSYGELVNIIGTRSSLIPGLI